MKVSASLDFLQSIANDPRVFPSIASFGAPPFDLSGAQDCFGVEWSTGGLIFHRQGQDFEVHILFLPDTKDTARKAREAIAHVFAATDATRITARIPDDLPHCRHLAVAVGFERTGHTENAIPRAHGCVGFSTYQRSRTDA